MKNLIETINSYFMDLSIHIQDFERRLKRLESKKKSLEPEGFVTRNKAAAALAYCAVSKKLPFYWYAVGEFIKEFNWNDCVVSGVMIRETFERCRHIMAWDTDLDILARDVMNLIVRETK